TGFPVRPSPGRRRVMELMTRTTWVLSRWLGVLVLSCWLSLPAAGQPPAVPAAPRQPEVWAIVVGVGDYAQASRWNSPTPAHDAEKVLRWIRQAGWDDGRHQLLLSDFGAADPGEPDLPAPNIQPLKRNLDWAFHQWLFPKVKSGDIVVVYFAGRSRAVIKP